MIRIYLLCLQTVLIATGPGTQYRMHVSNILVNFIFCPSKTSSGRFRLEMIVHKATYSHVAPYLTDWQHGFTRGRSCATQLVLTHHQWTKALDDGLQVDVVFLDISKAFDRVSHDLLLHKLCNFGISGSLLNWCENYLSHREQRVLPGLLFHLVFHRVPY